jgi:hypothetical protein
MHVHARSGIFEPFSALTHLAKAAIFALLGLALMHRAHGDDAGRAPRGVAASSVFLLSVSATLHMLPEGQWRARRPRPRGSGSRAAIFAPIAGTRAAMHGLFFRRFSSLRARDALVTRPRLRSVRQ